MKTYYYYQSLRKTIIQFLDIFNDIRIARYESDGATVRGYLKVPLKFAPKSKTWYWINERKNDEVLPIMSATMQSCDFATDRVTNKDMKIIKSTSGDSGTVSRFLNPVPYNFGFQLSIWALFMVDIDQILEQILPFFEPQAFTQINIPELDATVDVKVVFQSCAPDVTFEYPDPDRRMLLWNLDFVVQGYIFRPITDSGIAEEIILNFYTDEDSFDNRNSLSVLTLGEPVTGASETMYLSGGGYDNDGAVLFDYEIFSLTPPTVPPTPPVAEDDLYIVPNEKIAPAVWANFGSCSEVTCINNGIVDGAPDETTGIYVLDDYVRAGFENPSFSGTSTQIKVRTHVKNPLGSDGVGVILYSDGTNSDGNDNWTPGGSYATRISTFSVTKTEAQLTDLQVRFTSFSGANDDYLAEIEVEIVL